MIRTIVSFTGVTVAALAFIATPAGATAASQTAMADLDGDGSQDTVVAQVNPADPAEQLLTATVRDKQYQAQAPGDEFYGVQPMRVADINGDGRQEIILTETVGANTDHFSVWGLTGDALQPVRTVDSEKLRLLEGGGVSSINRYGCEPAGQHRQLVTVSVLLDWETGIYYGDRVTYSVQQGVAHETSRTPVLGTYDAPVFQLDPQTCA